MKLIEQLPANGKFLFRWRSFIPLILVALITIDVVLNRDSFAKAFINLTWQFVCISICLIGAIIRIIVSGCAPKGTSGRATKNIDTSSLNTTGLYSLIRHPLYLGNFLIWLGITLFFKKWYWVVIIILFFILYYERIIAYEENYLEARFKYEFIEWSRKTPAFFIKFKDYKKSQLPFNFKEAIKKEHDSLYAIVVMLYYFNLLNAYILNHNGNIIRIWTYFFIFFTISWLAIKLAKKISM